MTTLSYPVPVAGTTLNSIADPEIATAFSTILTWANGNIDTTNIKSVIPSGLLSARPAAGSASGAFYYATDTGLLYWSNGSAWTIVTSPTGVGSWQALTLASGVTTGSGYTPSARLEGADVVRLKGDPTTNGSTTINSGGVVATLPAPLAPSTQIPFLATGTSLQMMIDVTGHILMAAGNNLVPSTGLHLNGVTYTLS